MYWIKFLCIHHILNTGPETLKEVNMWPAQMNVLKTVALFGLYEWLDIVPTWIYTEPVVDRVTEVFYHSTRHIRICQWFGNIYDVVKSASNVIRKSWSKESERRSSSIVPIEAASDLSKIGISRTWPVDVHIPTYDSTYNLLQLIRVKKINIFFYLPIHGEAVSDTKKVLNHQPKLECSKYSKIEIWHSIKFLAFVHGKYYFGHFDSWKGRIVEWQFFFPLVMDKR